MVLKRSLRWTGVFFHLLGTPIDSPLRCVQVLLEGLPNLSKLPRTRSAQSQAFVACPQAKKSTKKHVKHEGARVKDMSHLKDFNTKNWKQLAVLLTFKAKIFQGFKLPKVSNKFYQQKHGAKKGKKKKHLTKPGNINQNLPSPPTKCGKPA